jgi:hypothetical protein
MARPVRLLLRALLAEKVVQHAVVTWAFAADALGLRETVVVDHRWLMVSGGIAAVLFAAALAGQLAGRAWSLPVAGGLACFDIAGEFVAQGTLAITVTVSFVVAIAVLVLAWREVRRSPQLRTGQPT